MSDLFRVTNDLGAPARPASATGGPGPGDVAALAVYLADTAETLASDSPVAREALGYLARRFGMAREQAIALGLGVDPGGSAHVFSLLSTPYRAVPRLVIPFRCFDGVPLGMQGRDLTGEHKVRWCGPTNPAGGSWARMGVFTSGAGLDTMIVTEGPGDALAAVAAGYDALFIRGASLAGNGPTVDALVSGLTGRRVVVAGDRDHAGEAFSRRIVERLTAHDIDVSVLRIPDAPADGDLAGWYEHAGDDFAWQLARELRVAAPVATATAVRESPGVGMAGHYRMTDVGNAERLCAALGGWVRYAPETGFYLWNGAVWVLDRCDAVRTAAQAMSKDMLAHGETLRRERSTQKEGEALAAWGLKSQASRAIDFMIKELAALDGVAVDIDILDANPDVLAFVNGTVELRTGALRPHDPADMLTRMVATDYDPDAKALAWEAFLEQVFPEHPALPAFIRRLIGYGITGRTTEQCFAVLWGTGGNGKSVFTDTLTHVFRQITTTTPFSTFELRQSGGIPNDLAALKGARLVVASEGEQGKPMAESILKRITGSELISARFMRREFFEFRPSFLIMMATNHKPRFKGADDGLWRRVKLIPWLLKLAPDEQDHYLAERLKAEAPGIAAWAVRGAMEWYAEGLQEPGAIRSATREYRREADALFGFFPGKLQPDRDGSLVGSAAYNLYQEWCAEEGLQHREIWTRRSFYGALAERGIPRVHKDVGMVLQGIRLATPEEYSLPGMQRTANIPQAHIKGRNPPAVNRTESTGGTNDHHTGPVGGR